ncbi:MAG: toxin [Elusimicrobia bacterium RIFCSPLOWO2_02_FULL_39_32]|nr:MAG: toxin [Elusimicrobia bacterium GWA2_38_7]OGR79910.1 MAG: toxin [Elusimicrobia bacterium RIFCSPHIGHO2_02_FULL_39_36]OGR93445.1 MAG: toxin [Elusimicrobia bacterium RIFCSPLOWO2_02_FULL_39_32]OGS00292.1 MAG: toxin [Elusimicrobia bacterium RIFCSPLOWO2_12_FULL_39_28]
MGGNYVWNTEKNKWLKANRGISFEEVVFCIEHDGLVDTIKHPNSQKYSNQQIFVVAVNNYIYYIPFVRNRSEFFLKTIIPSRKGTKRYLSGGL